VIHRLMGRPDLALPCNIEALTLHRETGDRAGEASALENLAAYHLDHGDVDQAMSYAQAAFDIADDTANPRVVAATHAIVAKVHLRRGNHRMAKRHYEIGLRCARDNRVVYIEVGALLGLAATHKIAGRPDTALELCTEALHTAEAAGFQIHEATARTLLAELANDRGEPTVAASQATLAVTIHDRTHCRSGMDRASAVLVSVRRRS
jgi:tetratricopeptide (TPR) repeat protein